MNGLMTLEGWSRGLVVVVALTPSWAHAASIDTAVEQSSQVRHTEVTANMVIAAPADTSSESRSAGQGSKRSGPIRFEDAFEVDGRLEKPSAYYILKRSDPDFDWARLDVRFLPLVLESVQDSLF